MKKRMSGEEHGMKKLESLESLKGLESLESWKGLERRELG